MPLRQIISKRDIERLQESLIAVEMAAAPQGGGFRDAPAPLSVAAPKDHVSDLRAQVQAGHDTYSERLVKYIPTEVIALYLTLLGILSTSPHRDSKQLGWIIFGFCLSGTPLYLWKITQVRKVSQLVLSTSGFCIWAFSLGSPFSLYGWYDPLYPALVLPAYTFLVPMLDM
jgi:hypothetical protein